MKMEESQIAPEENHRNQRYKNIEEPDIDVHLPGGANIGLKNTDDRLDTDLMNEQLKKSLKLAQKE